MKYHKCKMCNTKMSEGSPALCPTCQEIETNKHDWISEFPDARCKKCNRLIPACDIGKIDNNCQNPMLNEETKLADVGKWENILDRVRFWLALDDKFQKAIDNFCKEIAPTEYAPCLDRNCVRAFIEGFCGKDQQLKNDFEYWLYEASYMKEAFVIQEYRKWDFKKDEDFIDYLIFNYPLKFSHD